MEPEPSNEVPIEEPTPAPGAQSVAVGASPRLLIDAHGNVRIKRGANDVIRAEMAPQNTEGTSSPMLPSFSFRLESDVGGVHLKSNTPMSDTLQVEVPVATDVHVTYLAGALKMDGLTGDFSARSRQASIELQNHGGGIDIELDAGTVKLPGYVADGKNMQIAVGKGSVTVDILAQNPGSARIEVDDGRIEVSVASYTRARLKATNQAMTGTPGERMRKERYVPTVPGFVTTGYGNRDHYKPAPMQVEYTFRGGGELWELIVKKSESRFLIVTPDNQQPDTIDGLKPLP